jgi:hypothetical protein
MIHQMDFNESNEQTAPLIFQKVNQQIILRDVKTRIA